MAIDLRPPDRGADRPDPGRMGRSRERTPRVRPPVLAADARNASGAAGNEDAAMAQAVSSLLELTRSAFRIGAEMDSMENAG